jgi:thymidine phosphorylase
MAQSVGSALHVEYVTQRLNTEIAMTEFENEVLRLLKQILLATKKGTREMNNEPVAHFYPEGEGCTVFSSNFVFKYQGTKEPIPLYTHPANPKYDPETGEPLIDGYPLFSGLPPAKTLTETEDTECQYCKQGCIRCDARKLLTDKEILEVFVENYGDDIFPNIQASGIEFARAILRKAQEK